MNKGTKLHTFHAIVTILLLITGFMLYSQFFRGSLSSVRIYLRVGHAFLGVLFTISIFLYISLLRKKPYPFADQDMREFLNMASIILCLGASLSGILLFAKIDIDNAVGFSALDLHKWIVIMGFSAILYHGVMGLFFYKPSQTLDRECSPEDKGYQTGRRKFIGWVAAVGALLSGGLLTKWLIGIGGNSQAKKMYKNCNKMETEPIPSLGSLPPIGGGYKGEFEVFTVVPKPCTTSKDWRFKISGLVNEPITMTWSQFLVIPRKVQVSNFYCITGWSVYDVTYEGIPLSWFIRAMGVQPGATHVKFTSYDNSYTSALTIEQATMDDVMVVVLMDGEPIPSDLGGPARLIVPQMYAYKGVKWLEKIEFIDEPYSGYWESRGYVNDAWVTTKKL